MCTCREVLIRSHINTLILQHTSYCWAPVAIVTVWQNIELYKCVCVCVCVCACVHVLSHFTLSQIVLLSVDLWGFHQRFATASVCVCVGVCVCVCVCVWLRVFRCAFGWQNRGSTQARLSALRPEIGLMNTYSPDKGLFPLSPRLKITRTTLTQRLLIFSPWISWEPQTFLKWLSTFLTLIRRND